MSIFYKNARIVRFVLFRKNSNIYYTKDSRFEHNKRLNQATPGRTSIPSACMEHDVFSFLIDFIDYW